MPPIDDAKVIQFPKVAQELPKVDIGTISEYVGRIPRSAVNTTATAAWYRALDERDDHNRAIVLYIVAFCCARLADERIRDGRPELAQLRDDLLNSLRHGVC